MRAGFERQRLKINLILLMIQYSVSNVGYMFRPKHEYKYFWLEWEACLKSPLVQVPLSSPLGDSRLIP